MNESTIICRRCEHRRHGAQFTFQPDESGCHPGGEVRSDLCQFCANPSTYPKAEPLTAREKAAQARWQSFGHEMRRTS